MKEKIKKIISWFISLFRKKIEVSNKYELIRITAGGRHAWVNSKFGIIRKPLTSL